MKMCNHQQVFEAAIAANIFSLNEQDKNYIGPYMYMGDNEQGQALFKHIETREYLPAATI